MKKAPGKCGSIRNWTRGGWPQFSGLKEPLEGYQQKVEQRISEWATVTSGGLVDDAAVAQRTVD